MDKRLLGGGAAIIFFVALVAYYFNEKERRKTAFFHMHNENLEHENEILKDMLENLHSEVQQIVENNKDIPDDAKEKLKALVMEYQDIDENIVKELSSVSALIEAKQSSKAILSLAKILENVFKRIFKDDKEIKKNARFVTLIEHAHKKNLIDKEEYHYLSAIRMYRNQEAHEVGVSKDEKVTMGSMFLCFSIISKMSRFLRGAA